MSKLDFKIKGRIQVVIVGFYEDLKRHIVESLLWQYPVDIAESFLKLCHVQLCGNVFIVD